MFDTKMRRGGRSSSESGFHKASPFANHFHRVPGEGPKPARLMLIGERPGQEEARKGRPFIGPSGRALNTCLEVAGLNRSEIYITNLVKTFNQYGKPTREDIARDHDELVQEIIECDPEVIALVGGWAVEGVLGMPWGEKAPMEKWHGVPRRCMSLFGGELEFCDLTSTRSIGTEGDGDDGGDNGDDGNGGGWLVIPTYHPANTIYSPDMWGAVLDDILRVAMLLAGEIHAVVDDWDEAAGGKLSARARYVEVSSSKELAGLLRDIEVRYPLYPRDPGDPRDQFSAEDPR